MADTRLDKLHDFLYEEELDTSSPALLMKQLATAEAYLSFVSSLRSDAAQKLTEARNEHLPPKNKEYTELDRKTLLDALVAKQQNAHDKLAGVERHLYTRISLGQTMLKQFSEELKRQIDPR